MRCDGRSEREVLLGLLDKIDRFGFTVIGVPGGRSADGRRSNLPFAYTVGLTPLGKPELLIHGQELCLCYELLYEVGNRIRDGRPVAAGDVGEHDVPGGLEVRAIQLTDPRDLVYVGKLYGVIGPSLQLVWPDRRGRMFWEPSYSLTRRAQQIRGVAPNAQQLQRSSG